MHASTRSIAPIPVVPLRIWGKLYLTPGLTAGRVRWKGGRVRTDGVTPERACGSRWCMQYHPTQCIVIFRVAACHQRVSERQYHTTVSSRRTRPHGSASPGLPLPGGPDERMLACAVPSHSMKTVYMATAAALALAACPL
jgi:hypothetical protein